jgi:LysR family transcriptional regulator, transcriptional activator for leuABCD operon
MFNLRSLDLNLLTVFEAIYELSTVSAAASRLALSQSATSHALSRLREVCGDDLFVRARQGLSPTPVAREMFPAIKQALDALRATLAEASGFDAGTSQRRFRISIPHPIGPFYALHLRAAVTTTAPGVSLTFNTTSMPVDLEQNLRDGTIDIALDWLAAELDPFVNQKVFDDQLILLVRRGHPLIKTKATLDDLRRVEFVGPHRRRGIEHLPSALREFYKLGLPEAVRVNELLEIPTVVVNTNLVGIFPSSMGALMQKQLGLKILPLPIDVPEVPIYMVWHETRRHDAAHRWLRGVVVQELVRFAES